MRLDEAEILRYLGSAERDPALLDLICAGSKALAAHAVPRHTLLRLHVTLEGDVVRLGTLAIQSAALSQHLAGCSEALVFAATLGAPTDRLMAQYSKTDISMALVLQACAASAIECYCDDVCAALAQEYAHQGLYLRPRFSPGYGGFDIGFQQDILRLLKADQRIGLCVTASHMLTPLKSVTALIGLSPSPQPCDQHKCTLCPNKGCAFRKE